MPHRPAPLALTLGEPAGIGPEITVKAWLARNSAEVPPFYLLGDPEFIASRASRIATPVPVCVGEAGEAADHFSHALPVVPLAGQVVDEPGRIVPANSAAVVESITLGVDHLRRGLAAALVTNPIHKKALYQAGFAHPGHTEFLAELAGRWGLGRPRPVMMLVGPELRTVPLTIHIPLGQVPAAVSMELIIETASIVAAELERRFMISSPRLAIAGLNPHAGEGGAMGSEEEKLIRPAIEALSAAGIDARGPFPADTLFHPAARAGYDAAICMYHDQALIPVKTLAFSESVNVTLGLPFVRTSPDHGTAFDLAGTGAADPASLIAALKLAAHLAGAPAAGTPH